ncbi:MAG TPA: hypothetical protein VGR41_01345 [Actinomycetota bacterium]|jgi:uncharacterized cupredoxin-like copper-binding protein|nr:hypothetical protein [Actinomycetota bacterium]
MKKRLALVAAVALFAVSCSDSGQDANAGPGIGATLKDFSISLETENVTAGSTTFDIVNDGPSTHELEVFRTDLAHDALPVEGSTVADDQLEIIDEVEDIAPGTSTPLTVELPRGRYVVICNIADHYEAGMHAGITVT